MRVKTRDLTGTALNWAVAQLEKPQLSQAISNTAALRHGGVYAPSTDWAQGGPIIEREWISVWHVGTHLGATAWKADQGGLFYSGVSSTPLIAAMRCYVASKLGETVDIPDELLLPGAYEP